MATKEETIICSPDHQAHECDTQQAEEATMSRNIWMVKIWQIHERSPNLPNFLAPKFPSVRCLIQFTQAIELHLER